MKRRIENVFWTSSSAFALFSAAAGVRLLHPIDIRLLHAAQGRASASLDAAAAIFSVPGTLEYVGVAMLALGAGLFFSGRRALAARLLAAFVATGLLEFAMKLWLPQVPMPDEAARSTDPSPILEVYYPYPYPSGHMLRSVMLLGAVFVLWPNRLLRAGILAILSLVAASRVYLGVHWASDVLGGALLGIAGLAWAFKGDQRSAVNQELKADG